MTIKNLYTDINVFYSSCSDKYELSNPFYHLTRDGIISWFKYLPKETFYTYEEYYQWATDNLQYSLAIADKAYVQIFFQESRSKITRASLSFLPNPRLLMTYFRFDMDLTNAKDYYHNSYHVNFGYNSDDFRFSLHRFPYPSEFMRFCLFLLGNPDYCKFDRKRFFTDLSALGEKYSHSFDFIVS